MCTAFDTSIQNEDTYSLAPPPRPFTFDPEAPDFQPGTASKTVYHIVVRRFLPEQRLPLVHGMYGTLEDAKAKLADLVVAAATESKLQHVFLGWDGMHVAFG